MTLVKICGLSDMETALFAAECGADLLGFVFAQSRRQVTPDTVVNIVNAVKSKHPKVETIGVFANSPISEMNAIADYCRLDRVQLSGGESWQYCQQTKKPIIKVIHVKPDTRVENIIASIVAGNRLAEGRIMTFLLDSKGTDDRPGGTGQIFDWAIARHISRKFPVFIAGGLNTRNIARLLTEVNPFGVDVSSGVETDGKKDLSKIRAFIQMIRQKRASNRNQGKHDEE